MTTAQADRVYNWHPFTPTDSWLDPAYQPVSIVQAEGSLLTDEQGRTYLDGNSSIWTITHGHRHPHLVEALRRQLEAVEHVSFLGLTHPWAGKLAQKLSEMAGGGYRSFFSDDGSTGIEAALKIVWQYFQQNGQPQRTRMLSLSQGYHGDTIGAMSLGQSEAFHSVFKPLMFETHRVMAPTCYRCPYNQAQAQAQDAREYRRCEEQCVQQMLAAIDQAGTTLAAVVLEPRIQAAAGMWMHPEGYLAKIAQAVAKVGGKLIADEVFTGFGRTGHMLAQQKEGVQADLIVLGKGLTGGFLPMAATLVREEIFQGFRGGVERTFFHGHSYTANPLGCAVAIANLEVYEKEGTLVRIEEMGHILKTESQIFWQVAIVGDVRCEGAVLAIELVESRATRRAFPPEQRVAHQVGELARKRGLLTRGMGSVLVIVPPYGTSDRQLKEMVQLLAQALEEWVSVTRE